MAQASDRSTVGGIVVIQAPLGWGKSALLGQLSGKGEHPMYGLSAVGSGDTGDFVVHRLPGTSGEESTNESMERRARLLQRVAIDAGSDLALYDLGHGLNSAQAADVLVRHVATLHQSVTIVLASCRPVPPAFFRRVSRSHLRTLTPRDLALTGEEAVARMLCPPVAELNLEDLMTLTQGWPAGVDALSRNRSKHECLMEIYGRLEENLMRHESARVQRFLMECAVADPVDAASASAIFGYDDAPALIAQVRESDLFVFHDTGDTLSLHPLFRQFLCNRLLVREGVSAFRTLHSRISRYHERRDWTRAVVHAFESGDAVRAGEMLNRDPFARLTSAERSRILACELVEPVPAKVHLWLGRIATMNLDSTRAERAFENAALVSEKGTSTEVEARTRQLEARIRFGPIVRSLQDLVPATVEPTNEADIHAAACLAALQLYMGEHSTETSKTLRALWKQARLSESDVLPVVARAHGFAHHLTVGSFREGTAVLDEAIAAAMEVGRHDEVIQLRACKAALLLFNGDLNEADDALEVLLDGHERSFGAHAIRLTRAMVELERGRAGRCTVLLDDPHFAALPAQLEPWYLRTRLLLQIRENDLDNARETRRKMLDALERTGANRSFYAPECFIAAAMSAAAARDFKYAHKLVKRVLSLASTRRMYFWQVKAAAVRVWLDVRRGVDDSLTVRRLSRCLKKTARCGFEGFWRHDSLGLGPRLEHFTKARGLANEAAHLARLCATDARPLETAADTLASKVQTERESTAPIFPVRIKTLGRFSLQLPGRSVAPGSRPEAVLKFLLSQKSLSASREVLIDALWPDSPPGRAASSLHNAISQLRSVLVSDGAVRRTGHIIREGDTYRLVTDGLHIDALEFESFAKQGLETLKRGAVDEAVSLLQQAEALYEGHFLMPTDPCAEWAHDRRDDLSDLWRRALESLANIRESALSYPLARSTHERILKDINPHDETAAEGILRCLRETGEHAAGLRFYNNFVSRLREEIDVEPSERLADLAESFRLESRRPKGLPREHQRPSAN